MALAVLLWVHQFFGFSPGGLVYPPRGTMESFP
jgi:hypothetical protein